MPGIKQFSLRHSQNIFLPKEFVQFQIGISLAVIKSQTILEPGLGIYCETLCPTIMFRQELTEYGIGDIFH